MSRPLRLLILNYEYPPIGGGAGTGCKFLAQELAKRGHLVEVVTSAFENLPRRSFRQYPGGGSLRIRRIPVLRREAGRCRPHEMATFILSAFAHLLFRGDLRRFDALLSFHTIPSGVPAWPWSWWCNVPHVVLFRGGDVPGFLPGELQLLHRITYPLNSAIVLQSRLALANSNGLRRMAQRAFPFKEIGVIQNGVDARLFHPGNRFEVAQPNTEIARIENAPIRLMFAGRMTSQKGLDTLGAALALLKDVSWEITLAGEGPERAPLEELLRREGLIDRAQFLGWQKRLGLAKEYRRADVFVFPSRYEGMPNALLEALSSGCAVVATPIAGSVDLVQHGETGLLTPVDDPQALADALRQLIQTPEKRRELGSNARREILSHWAWSTRAGELEAMLKEISSKKS